MLLIGVSSPSSGLLALGPTATGRIDRRIDCRSAVDINYVSAVDDESADSAGIQKERSCPLAAGLGVRSADSSGGDETEQSLDEVKFSQNNNNLAQLELSSARHLLPEPWHPPDSARTQTRTIPLALDAPVFPHRCPCPH
ncbi:unnamed protein product [Pleuronectes platessa]|uniref:Uncharacterized protein n=1 Tax=Pleuronectes platessa TaxID=8262 RepID=A0A9N7TZW8_PLEPL|nr:unnamed protein product [Pleuronectes platessa]